jgi:hypothetical protein
MGFDDEGTVTSIKKQPSRGGAGPLAIALPCPGSALYTHVLDPQKFPVILPRSVVFSRLRFFRGAGRDLFLMNQKMRSLLRGAPLLHLGLPEGQISNVMEREATRYH